MNRRNAMRVIGTGAVGTLAVTAFKCDSPNLDPKFQIALTILSQVSATLNELHITGPLGLISKVTKVLTDVRAFYKKADFTSAISALNDVIAPGGLFDQVLADAEIQSSNVVKGFLIAFRGALTVIAVILAGQESNPAVTKAVKSAKAADATKVNNVRAWADPKRIDALLKAQ